MLLFLLEHLEFEKLRNSVGLSRRKLQHESQKRVHLNGRRLGVDDVVVGADGDDEGVDLGQLGLASILKTEQMGLFHRDRFVNITISMVCS